MGFRATTSSSLDSSRGGLRMRGGYASRGRSIRRAPGERRGRGSPATLEDPIRPRDTGAHGIPEGDELLATIVDELRRAVRYDAGLFPERAIDRIVFLGAGAESDRVCRHIVQALQLPGQRADPVARHEPPAARSVPASWNGAALPAWTTTLGLLRPDRTRERRHAA